ncbi:hypothetical protein BC830DRAFT_1174480 [Chytriomyces sp. MP71]|nr:hypothetical protein BC830DRAFT_1174480 [Chytriomyces sp. MP71]
MGGHGPFIPHGPFVAPKVSGTLSTKVFMAGVWFFCLYRLKVDGPHHFLKHHPWEEPKMLAYLEKVDKKYGTHYATDNMHH